MTTTIIKQQSGANSKGHKMIGCSVFKTKLPKEAVKFIGNEVIIRKHLSHFELSKFGKLSEGRPAIITESGWLTLSQKLVEEWTDLGEYEIDYDHESEIINLIKK